MSQTLSLTHVKFWFFDNMFVDQFGRSLQIFHLEFDKEAISDGYRSENARCQCKGGFEFQVLLESWATVVLVDLFILFLTLEENTECASRRNYWPFVLIPDWYWTLYALGTNNTKVFRHVPGFSGASLALWWFQN